MKKKTCFRVVVVAGAAMAAVGANAQSSVTLYGAIDTGLAYQSSAAALGANSGGRSVVKMTSGAWWGSRFGLKGSEDLGGGAKTIFVLEAGFTGNNGAQQYTNALFGRQVYIGLTQPSYGTFTIGRQYNSYYQMLAQYGPTTYLSGAFGAHPGDLDGLDTIYRTNNTFLYTSPTVHGITVSASFADAGVPGSINRGSTWAVATKYAQGPVGFAAGILRINNSTAGGGAFGPDSTTSNGGTQLGVSSITNGYQTAQAQQRIAIEGAYIFNSAWDMSASYSNTQYIPGAGSAFRNTAIFNTAGVVLHWKPTYDWDFAAGYAHTRATSSNGITNAARYHQFSLTEYYTLSKRTSFYFAQTWQHASGKTLGTAGSGNVINATASVGDFANGTPSSSANMLALGTGLIHKF